MKRDKADMIVGGNRIVGRDWDWVSRERIG